MAADMIAGPHGRDVTSAESAWSTPQPIVLDGPVRFRDVLNALNPLQFVPVVGTIYRVVTGDQGSPPLRTAMSMITGAAMGGPVGLLTSIAGALAEHFLHLEQAAHSIIAGSPAASRATGSGPPSAAVPVPAAAAPAHDRQSAPPPATLAASGAANPLAEMIPPPALAAAKASPAPAQAALPHVSVQALAAYSQVAELPTRVVWGGAER